MADIGRWSNTEGAHGEQWLAVHTVTQAEDDAGTLDIKTQLRIIEGWQYNAFNSSDRKLADTFDSSASGGVITIADGGNAPAVGDVIKLTAFGKGGR